MIIYNKEWLDNLLVHEQVDAEQRAGSITPAEVTAIKMQYPVGFYMPNVFVRVGLFILACIIGLSSTGVLGLIAEGMIQHNGYVLSFLIGIAAYILLEIMVKSNKYYGSGVDDALLWITFGSFTGGFMWFVYSLDTTYQADHYLSTSIFVFLLGLYLTLRFADNVMSALTCLALFAVVYFAGKSLGSVGITIMPFLMIAASAAAYFVIGRLHRDPVSLYYRDCLADAKIVSLAVLYAAGNYYVVDQLSAMINGPSKGGIPLGFFFWGWTIVMPLVYIGFGIKKKDTMLLRMGIFLVEAAVATFRYYYHVIPAEWALMLGGCILLAIVYSLVRYLKTDKYGFTYADINNTELSDSIKIESLITAATFSHTTDAPVKPEDRFGGGSFGGGGSSSNY